MSLLYRKQGHYLVVFGQTYPVKEQIKSLGGRFDGATKAWRLPNDPEILSQVEALCRSYGGGLVEESGGQSSLSLPSERQEVEAPFKAVSPVVEVVAKSESEVSPLQGAITVRQLLDRAQGVVAQAFQGAIWIVGEIQNLSTKTSAIFFDLAEARDSQNGESPEAYGVGDLERRGHSPLKVSREGRKAQPGGATLTIRCILWTESLRMIRTLRGQEAVDSALQDGLKVALRCRVQFYKDRAQLSLVVEDLDPSYTKGALALAREKLLKELRAKGLDKANSRLDFPLFPFDVGLISAEGSRAFSDFTHQLEMLGFPGRVHFSPSPMQGDSVPEGVIKALGKLTQKGCDVIVITRGGGSAADLRWFDDRSIAYAIAEARVPIVSAIGHHDDRCVAEEVSYVRQKTPTAAADFIMAIFQKTTERISEAHETLLRGFIRRRDGFEEEAFRLGEKVGRLALLALETRRRSLDDHKNLMERQLLSRLSISETSRVQLENKIAVAAERYLVNMQTKLMEYEQALVKKDPKPWLLQGWTQLQDKNGHLLRSISEVQLGDLLRARLLDGQLHLVVEKAVNSGHRSR